MLALEGDPRTDSLRLPPGHYFGVALRQVEENGLTVTLTRYPVLGSQPWHTHENPTFFLMIRGDFLDHSLRNETHIEPLSLVFHPTDEVHRSETGASGAIGLNIETSPEWLASHDLSSRKLGPYALLANPRSRMAALRLLVHAFGPHQVGPSQLEADALEVISLLNSVRGLSHDKHDKPAPSWLPRVEAYLRDSLDEAGGLRDAARKACVHPVYLARVFRQHYGCSVGEYIRRMRVLHAASYALQSHGSLADAAHEARFADQSHFSRVFMRETGLSPKVLLRVRAAL